MPALGSKRDGPAARVILGEDETLAAPREAATLRDVVSGKLQCTTHIGVPSVTLKWYRPAGQTVPARYSSHFPRPSTPAGRIARPSYLFSQNCQSLACGGSFSSLHRGPRATRDTLAIQHKPEWCPRPAGSLPECSRIQRDWRSQREEQECFSYADLHSGDWPTAHMMLLKCELSQVSRPRG
jgi:hypothetical protein